MAVAGRQQEERAALVVLDVRARLEGQQRAQRAGAALDGRHLRRHQLVGVERVEVCARGREQLQGLGAVGARRQVLQRLAVVRAGGEVRPQVVQRGHRLQLAPLRCVVHRAPAAGVATIEVGPGLCQVHQHLPRSVHRGPDEGRARELIRGVDEGPLLQKLLCLLPVPVHGSGDEGLSGAQRVLHGLARARRLAHAGLHHLGLRVRSSLSGLRAMLQQQRRDIGGAMDHGPRQHGAALGGLGVYRSAILQGGGSSGHVAPLGRFEEAAVRPLGGQHRRPQLHKVPRVLRHGQAVSVPRREVQARGRQGEHALRMPIPGSPHAGISALLVPQR
mmetsp:Transcript_70813/g.207500  ORF Transcript_70813/g.207500 Transcript_70813/m.207500 type:complete len:332 (+) Transcript_70813:1292-2287(+)